MPTVLISLSHGFHVRNIVYSRLFEELSRTHRIVLVLPPGVQVPAADQPLLRGAAVESVTIRPHRFENVFLFLRKNVFAGRKRTQTFNLITEMERARHPVAYGVAHRLNAVAGRIPALGRLWQKVEAQFVPGTEFDTLFERERPDLVLTANYGTEAFEVRLLRAARRHGVPSLAIIPSWDNLSSKGVIGENPRHLAVWNDIMKNEAISLYGFAPKTVHVCGGLQFDRYAGGPTEAERAAVYQRLGIDAARPFVVVGTITPRYFAKNVEIVEILDEAVASGRLARDLQIVVRLHPQVVDDPVFGDNLDQYRNLAARSPRVRLSIPRVLRWGRITPPSPDDGVELMCLLQGAAASVMPASTLAIDACALGSPVIGIGFDGREHLPYARSVRRTFDFTHYRRLVAQGGMRIAESADALIEEVAAYLQDRGRDREGRDKVVASHLVQLDGAAWRRAGDVIAGIAKPPGVSTDAPSAWRTWLQFRRQAMRSIWLRWWLLRRGVYVGEGTRMPGGGALEFRPGSSVQRMGVLNARSGAAIRIGARSRVGAFAVISAACSISIEDDVLIADRVFIADHQHESADPSRPIIAQGVSEASPVVIGQGCWLGINVCVMPGVRLGPGCIVGAGAVVTRSFPAGSVIGGVPARLLRTRATAS